MNALYLKYLAAFGIGALLLLIVSFTIYPKSYFYKKMAVENGRSGDKPGLGSYLVTILIFACAIALFVLFDIWLLSDNPYPFIALSIHNLVLAFLLSIFDAFFIDHLILLVWRPKFLNLPPGLPTRAAMARHIRVQFSLGWIFLVAIALSSAGLASLTN